MSLQNFQKPPLTHQQHIELLKSRGLLVDDLSQATHYLEYVGYYRLSGYFWFFYKPRNPSHVFVPGTSFKTVVDLYEFDTAMRSLILRSIERIEVAARAVISNVMCAKYGAHWYLDKNLFKSNFRYSDFIIQVKKETDFDDKGGRKLIFKSYYEKYTNPELPASWMICEVLSLGTLSRVYGDIRTGDLKKLIAAKFKLPHYEVFSSWLQSICFTRNTCAHHAMVCYRNFHIIPLKPIDWTPDQQKIFACPNSLYLQLAAIQHLLHSVDASVKLKPAIQDLLQKYPDVSLQKMGFNAAWENDDIWS